jgi:hypothetical protein
LWYRQTIYSIGDHVHSLLLSVKISIKKPASEKGKRVLFFQPGNPAVLPRPAGLRPEALRPILSEGLPFSIQLTLVYVYTLHIGTKH